MKLTNLEIKERIKIAVDEETYGTAKWYIELLQEQDGLNEGLNQ